MQETLLSINIVPVIIRSTEYLVISDEAAVMLTQGRCAHRALKTRQMPRQSIHLNEDITLNIVLSRSKHIFDRRIHSLV